MWILSLIHILSANYVGDLERGVKMPKLETFIRSVEVLGVSADVLIRDSVPSASHVLSLIHI